MLPQGRYDSHVHVHHDANIEPEKFRAGLKAAGITMGTLRFSIGLEEPEDIIAEFDEALNKL